MSEMRSAEATLSRPMKQNTTEDAAGERIRRIGLGTVQFGLNYGISNVRGEVAINEAAKILSTARKSGVFWLDTAAVYGDAESRLGTLRAAEMGFRIVTKALPLTNGYEPILDRIRRSLDLLKIQRLDGLLVHQARDLAGPLGRAYWNALESLKASGKVSAIGISAYYDDGPLDLVKTYQPDLIQVPVSLLDQRLIRDGTLEALKECGVSIHARSIFLQGLLFLKAEQLPPKLKRFSSALSRVREIIASCGSTPLAAAISYVLERPQIDVAIVGTTSVQEISEVVNAARNPSPPIAWEELAINDQLVLTPSLW